MRRMVSLAAGTVLDVAPAVAVEVAAEAGFDAVGVWFDAASWSASTTRDVAGRLRATGLIALDVEPVIVGRGNDGGEALVDVAGELGAGHVLVASGRAERAAVVDRLGGLCRRAAPAGVTVVLEFLPIFSVASLDDAVDIVTEVGEPNAAVLVDTLHLARSGGTPGAVARLPDRLVRYLQLADAPAVAPGDLLDEALHGRLLPGEGGLPLAATLAAVPDLPVSVELRSRPLVERHPDPVERARVVLAATERVLLADT